MLAAGAAELTDVVPPTVMVALNDDGTCVGDTTVAVLVDSTAPELDVATTITTKGNTVGLISDGMMVSVPVGLT